MLTLDHIDNQFMTNRTWRTLFNRHYPVVNPVTYIADAWKLFVDNGYSYKMTRYSNNPASDLYVGIKEICLHDRKGDEVSARGDVNESSALEQLLIMVICEFDVDFNTFK